MAFTTMAQVLTAMPGQVIRVYKTIPHSNGSWNSSFTSATGFPPAGATPSSGLAGDVPTKSTVGAFPLVNPASGTLRVARLALAMGQANNAFYFFTLYDRLWHNSGISATAVTAQTINSVALTRPDANGANVEAWWQVYAVMGAGTPQVTLTYTDQDGNTGNTGLSGTLATTLAAQRTGIFTLASGDTGVRSIQTWQADATFTSGTIGLVMRRPICSGIVMGNQQLEIADVLRSGLAYIPDDACLELLVWSTFNSTTGFNAEIHVIEG